MEDQPDFSAITDIAAARREAIAAVISEDLETFSNGRRAAQRAFVHAVESSETTGDVRRSLTRFAIEASRDYAARALSFDARAAAAEMPKCDSESRNPDEPTIGRKQSSAGRRSK